MGFHYPIAEGQERDPRVLRAQLDLAATSVRNASITSPLWSVAAALLCCELTGVFGRLPLMQVLLLPLAVVLMVGLGTYLAHAYARKGDGSWFPAFVTLQVGASAAWGLMPWLCWQPGNVSNHLFLAAATMSVIAALVVSRGSNKAMYIASLAPISLMTSARFLLGDDMTDIAIGILTPFIALQLWRTGAPLVTQMSEDSRLRFKVQDMAKALEEARDEALRKRFEAEAANASKTAFLANMSHELRTPLNAILGFSEVIAQECFGPVGSDRYRDYAGDIHSSGAHLLSLINDLLDVAKIEAGRMEISPHPLEPQRMFEGALKLIASKAREKGQTLSITIAPDAPPLHADERALKQILINLVSNAVKFTPEGGHIAVVGGRSPTGAFQISVRDDGPGVPDDKLEKIFHPFNQVDNRFDRQAGGTGLGLALVRGLTELHGGKVWMESGQGKGCCVMVILPVIAPERSSAVA